MAEDEAPKCPFCGYEGAEYELLLHLETFHSEGESPFIVKDGEKAEEEQYAECPIEGCGEILLVQEMDDHVDFHAQEEELDFAEDTDTPTIIESSDSPPESSTVSRHQDGNRHRHDRSPASNQQAHAIQSWRKILSMPKAKNSAHDSADSSTSNDSKKKRLGKAELGKYAHEDRMPDWLVDHLKKGWGFKASGLIPVLEQLLEQSSTTRYAYLCHPSAQHVAKLKKEGGFCGYRNIQMMASYILGVQFQGSEHFKKGLPSIFDIQEFIEEAWDRGINSQGRVETGGVRGTRKYIGTPEAQAVFCSLQIPCDAQGFKDIAPGKSEDRLLEEVERYFQSGVFNPELKVRTTTLPPIYFQHAGHSMTIIGLEKLKSGHINLLVFDPMFHDAANILKLIDRRFQTERTDTLLKPYRRGNKYLKKYRQFEILKLRPKAEDLGH